MKKKYRVKTDRDFQRVFHEGTSVANRQFVIYYIPRAQNTHYRVGLSVSKRLGNAVKRNQIKRRIRHAVRTLDHKYQLQPTCDFIIIARQPVSRLDYWQILSSLRHVFRLGQLFVQPPTKKQSTKPEI